MSAGFRGASAGQDERFSNKEKKLLKTMTFPEELSRPVDLKKVNIDCMKPWISKRVTELLGFEDEVVENLVQNLLEEEEVNPKLVQIQLTPFLESNTPEFMVELWKLLLSAQENASGIPQAFLDAQAEERRRRRELDRKMDESFQSSNYRREGRRGGGRGWRRSRWEDSNERDALSRPRSRSPRRDHGRRHDNYRREGSGSDYRRGCRR